MYLRVRNQFQNKPEILDELILIQTKGTNKGFNKNNSIRRGRMMSECKMNVNPLSYKVELPSKRKLSFDSTDDPETRRRSFSNAPTKSDEETTHCNTFDNETFFYLFE